MKIIFLSLIIFTIIFSNTVFGESDNESSAIINNLTKTNNETELNESIPVIETHEPSIDQNDQTNLKILNDIKDTLIANQKQDEKAQLMYTVAQVSGIFIAILGGFLTTKLLTISTDKNRLTSQIEEIKTKTDNHNKIIEHYTEIKDNIGFQWAEENINGFVNELSNSDTPIPDSLPKLIELYKDEEIEINDYELRVLEVDYEAIIKRLDESRKQSGLLRALGSSSLIINRQRSDRQINEYKNANDKLMHEQAELESLENLRKQHEKDLSYITLPHSFSRIILILFFSAVIGVALPLGFIPIIENFGDFYTAFGISCFLISMLVTIIVIGHEIEMELKIKKGSKNPQPSKP